MRCSTAMCFPRVRTIRIHPSCDLIDFWGDLLGSGRRRRVVWVWGKRCWSRRFFLFWNSRGLRGLACLFFECKMKCVSLLCFGFWFEHVFWEDIRKTENDVPFFLCCLGGEDRFAVGQDNRIGVPLEAQRKTKLNHMQGPYFDDNGSSQLIEDLSK